jgi:hypothetical protein
MRLNLLSCSLIPMISLVAMTAIADEPTPFVIQSAEDKYSTDVAKTEALVNKAEAELVKARHLAGEARLKVYRDRLVEITKKGDFDKAQAIKARIVVLEREAEGDGSKSTKRPRPKETVKFGGHTYAIIQEKATWYNAKRRCEEMGGHLVTLDNPKEVAFVIELARSASLALWLGASNDERLEEWKWVNGRIADTTGWTFDDEVRQHFSKAIIWWPETNSINDHDLGAHCGYLCEWD